MLPKMLWCIHPTGVPSNKLPPSIWLPWAFFHYPRVCLQSHVGKLHLYLCQWKKFPSGNISRNQGKDLSNLLRSKEVTTGFPLSRLRFSPTPAKNWLVFFPKDYPITLHCLLRGEPADGPQARGAARDRQACILGHWGPSTPYFTGMKTRTGKNGPLPSPGFCTEGMQGETALGVFVVGAVIIWISSFCHPPSGTKFQADFNIKGGDGYGSVGTPGMLAGSGLRGKAAGSVDGSLHQWLDVGTRTLKMPFWTPFFVLHSLTIDISLTYWMVWPLQSHYSASSHIFNCRLKQLSCQHTSLKLSIKYALPLENRLRMRNHLPPCSPHSLYTKRGEWRETKWIVHWLCWRWLLCIHICQFIWCIYF